MTAPKRQEAEAVDPLSSMCHSALQRSLVADGASSTSGPRRMLSEAQVLAMFRSVRRPLANGEAGRISTAGLHLAEQKSLVRRYHRLVATRTR